MRCLTLLWFAVRFVLVVHGTGDHLEDAVDSTAVQPDVQRSHHQPLDGCLLNSGHCFLHTHHREVLGAFEQKHTYITCLKYIPYVQTRRFFCQSARKFNTFFKVKFEKRTVDMSPTVFNVRSFWHKYLGQQHFFPISHFLIKYKYRISSSVGGKHNKDGSGVMQRQGAAHIAWTAGMMNIPNVHFSHTAVPSFIAGPCSRGPLKRLSSPALKREKLKIKEGGGWTAERE